MSKTTTIEWQTDTQPPRVDDNYLVTRRIGTKDGAKYVVAVSKFSDSSKNFVCPIDRSSFFEAWPVAWAELPEPYKPN